MATSLHMQNRILNTEAGVVILDLSDMWLMGDEKYMNLCMDRSQICPTNIVQLF